MKLLRLLSARLRNPSSVELGFVRMGLGIERRAERFASEWKPHFERSKKAQEKLAGLLKTESLPRDKILILGAGRLYDVSEPVIEAFQSVGFVDADELCLPLWKKLQQKYPEKEFRFSGVELSGVLEDWNKRLGEEPQTLGWKELLDRLRTFGQSEGYRPSNLRNLCSLEQPDLVISLNILSQLPVMWQNLIEHELIRRFGASRVQEGEDEWLKSFLPSARFLVRRHLEDLAECNASAVLLISDVEYLYYVPESVGGRFPFEWVEEEVESGGWKLLSAETEVSDADVAAKCFSADPLYDVNIENEKLLRALFADWRVEYADSWIWNICPVPEKGMQEAVAHRVRAVSFVKENSPSSSVPQEPGI